MLKLSGRRLVHLHSHPQFGYHPQEAAPAESNALAVAISYQTGSGAMQIARRLAAHLQARTGGSGPDWQVFDKSLITKVLEDHRLPTRLARYLPEDASNPVDEVLDELFGLHPSPDLIVQHLVQTVLNLVRAGRVILVGWGASIITAKLPSVFQVRLVGSLERRLQRVQEREHLDRKQALTWMTRQDRGRERYVKRYFGQDSAEAALYHLTLNTDRFTEEAAACLIADTAFRLCHPETPKHHPASQWSAPPVREV
jgi:cytidylate kinase